MNSSCMWWETYDRWTPFPAYMFLIGKFCQVVMKNFIKVCLSIEKNCEITLFISMSSDCNILFYKSMQPLHDLDKDIPIMSNLSPFFVLKLKKSRYLVFLENIQESLSPSNAQVMFCPFFLGECSIAFSRCGYIFPVPTRQWLKLHVSGRSWNTINT